MSEIVTYEVYIYETSSWELVARYPVEKKSAAMEHAKSLEYSQQRPTKVVKEIYTPEDQTFSEKMVYLSDIPKPVPQKRNRIQQTQDFNLSAKNDKKKKKQSFAEAMMLLGATLVFSILISGALTYGVMRALIIGDLISEEVASQFSLSIFILTFLCISIPLSVNWVDWSVLFDDGNKNENKIKKVLAEQDASKKKENIINSYRNDQASWITKAFINFFARLHNEKTLEELIEEENNRKNNTDNNPPKLADFIEKSATEDESNEKIDENSIEENSSTEETDALDTTTDENQEDISDEKQESEQKQEEPSLSPELEQEFLKLTTFLSLVLKILQKQNILLNSYARFGIELFLAGSCETLCKRHHLSKKDNKQLVVSLLELLGRTRNLAEVFYNRLEEYMLEKQYLSMIQYGSQTLNLYLDTPSSPEVLTQIQNAMLEWIDPEEKNTLTNDSGIVTVMFTDMVGSTHMTQKYGDAAAQQIVRAHNSIVRQALNACSGKEIKQTGDGIMASFAWASNAIDAAISIQKATNIYNKKNPTIPLKIRIGLNAGEPIVEDNDLFGITVQLAARTCAQAEAGQIFISNVVRELASGKNYKIENKGFFSLKGIENDQNLHEVIWQEKNLNSQTNEISENNNEDNQENKQKLSQVLPEF